MPAVRSRSGSIGDDCSVTGLREVLVPSMPLARFRDLIGDERYETLEAAAARARTVLDGHTLWNVNSTASGGGVAEMLNVLVGYTRGAGLDVRWLVTQGDEQFFAITKRIHNRIHGVKGDDGDLGPAEAAHYDRITAENAALLREQLHPGDVALLHDPQTAGLCQHLCESGVHVIWRCHIGSNDTDEWTEQAWSFVVPRVKAADAFVFSRAQYVPEGIPSYRVHVIPPSIDPFSPKNRALDPVDVDRIVRRVGIYPGDVEGPAVRFVRGDGTDDVVQHSASIVGDGPLDPRLPLVVQVSRWDRLKDMQGVMMAFADGVVGRVAANLALVGPTVAGVADDPEGAAVLQECTDAWHRLRLEAQTRIRLVSLPMADIEANALMVNALQRTCTIAVQKSLAEGFGLTVAEAMWKAKPVVASPVGGIVDQIAPGTGVLLDDPRDLDACGSTVAGLLEQPDRMASIGANAVEHVVDHFVGDRHLLQYGTLLAEVLGVNSAEDRSG
jgi:trehalose synthase